MKAFLPKSDDLVLVRPLTGSEILPVPPLAKEGTLLPPFGKGAAHGAGGFCLTNPPVL